jgi:hypothetical protein
MPCGNCECKEIKFSCGIDPIINIMPKCNFAQGYSVDFFMSSRCDCEFYETCGLGYDNKAPGVVDCYDRQAFIDADVNGTYILSKKSGLNPYGFPYLFQYEYHELGEQIPLEDAPGSCGFIGQTGGLIFFQQEVWMLVTGIQKDANPYEGPEAMLTYNNEGVTAILSVTVSLRHTFPSSFPKIYINGVYGLDRIHFSETLVYKTTQPITCDGPLTFTHMMTSSYFQLADILGRNSDFSIYPTQLTLTPVQS